MNRFFSLPTSQPHLWIARGCIFAAWLTLTAAICALYLKLPPSPDIAVYNYIGMIVNQGGTLYVDVADQNWPGQMFIHSLSVWLFGNEYWSYRLFELAVILPASCFVLFAFLRYLGCRTAAWLVIPIYQVMYVTSGFWVSGQREIVAGPLLIAAAHALLVRIRGGSERFLVAHGAFLAAATLIRPTLLIMAPLLVLADLLSTKSTNRTFRNILQDHILATITLLAIAGVVAGIGAFTGALEGWYDVSVLFNVEVYSGGRSPLEIVQIVLYSAAESWSWYILLSLGGAALLWRRDRTALILVIMVLPAAFVSIMVQGKGFFYHFTVAIPLLALLIAVTTGFVWSELQKRSRPSGLMSTLLVLALLFPFAGLSKKLWTSLGPQREFLMGHITKEQMLSRYSAGEGLTTLDAVHIANYVDATTPAGVPILFWGRTCHIYSLTKRPSPLFAASFTLLADPNEEFSRFRQWQDKLNQAWREQPPSVLILVRNETSDGYLWIADGKSEHLSEVVTRNLPNYRYERSFGTADVLRRIDSPMLKASQ